MDAAVCRFADPRPPYLLARALLPIGCEGHLPPAISKRGGSLKLDLEDADTCGDTLLLAEDLQLRDILEHCT